MLLEDAIDCAATEVNTLLVQPADDLLPTTIVVFPPDGEYSPLEVRIHLTASWPLVGVLVVLNELSQAPQPYAFQPAIDGGPMLSHLLGDDRHPNSGPMEFPC